MVDYSRWDHIEISDDEDDTHPNIDTASLNKWRHEARIARMKEDEQEKEGFEKFMTELEGKRHLYEQKKLDFEKTEKIESNSEQEELLRLESEIVSDEQLAKILEEKLKTKERLTPLNVDTISRPGFSKSVVNKEKKTTEKELTEEERSREFSVFIEENEKLLKELSLIHKHLDTKNFLNNHPQLVSEHTTSYLAMTCMEMAMLEKCELFNHIAFQCVTLQFLFEMATTLKVDPKSCVNRFFSQISNPDTNFDYKAAFNEELQNFRLRVIKRANEKIAEAEEEERRDRLGPGGLDPLEVFESLPENLKRCFEEKSMEKLQESIKEMDVQEAEYHMNRCVDSGLWVLPNALEDTEDVKSHSEEEKHTNSENPSVESEQMTKEKLATDCPSNQDEV